MSMQVVNLIGGPNTGKTTTAYGLTYLLKRTGRRVEYVSEYAKDMVYELRDNILADQLYILAKQNRRLHRLREKMDIVITDSPLLLSLVYSKPNDPPEFAAALQSYWNSYNNVCFCLPRNRDFRYETEGRVQNSHDEASVFDLLVEKFLPEGTIHLDLGTDYVDQVLTHLGLSEEVATIKR